MSIQLRTLMFHSKSEEQIQAHLRLKKSVTSLPAAIGALSSPLGPHPERDLATDLCSGSTLIAIIDESDCRISFNSIKESATSLSAVIGALDSPLGSHPEIDLITDLYSSSTTIAIINESDRRIHFNGLKKFITLLSTTIGASDSSLGPHPKRDLTADLYSVSTPIAIIDEFDHQISSRQLQESYNITI
jgi:hypothetical protein